MDSLEFQISRSIRRYNTHPIQRRLYTYDLLVLPPILCRFIKLPEIIVQPENVDEVQKILEIADKNKIPVVPRGAATSAYGGAVPVKECIVVDFTRMNNIEVKNGKVIVESGAIWWDIEKILNKNGLALRVYPTSAPSSTVGGWIAQGGYGVGSLKYGGIIDNIEWLEVVDFSGVKKVSGNELKYYVGLHGSTGLITKVCLKVRENREIKSFAVPVSFEESLDVLDSAYHAAYFTSEFLQCSGWEGNDVLLVCFEEDKEFDGDIDKGKFLWDNRFMQLRAARFGRVVFSEMLLPYERASDFLKKVRKLGAAVEVIFSKEYAVFFGIFKADKFYSSLMSALKFIKIGEKSGGKIYSTGMLFPYKKVFDEDTIRYKSEVDPNNLLNPGKAVQTNAIANIVRIAEMIV